MTPKQDEDIEYPRAILHVDGDGFFASCEVVRRPDLRGKPVVVGAERGIATAMTYEAKALGITRGMPIGKIRREHPEVTVFHGDYAWYAEMSRRMNRILHRFTPEVEPYSIDESFADFTGYQIPRKTTYEAMAARFKREVQSELGMTFSVGLAPTKTLAKVASKYQKPDGLVCIPMSRINEFLTATPIGKVWGIGRRTSARLEDEGVSTAYAFTQKSERWVDERFSKPYLATWKELRGEMVLPVRRGLRGGQKSFMHSRTFSPPTSDRKKIYAELVRHVEAVMRSAREDGVAPKSIGIFLKTQTFQYQHAEIRLTPPSNIPSDVLPVLERKFEALFDTRTVYRATGVSISDFVSDGFSQQDLFDTARTHERFAHIYENIDALNEKYGKNMVRLASSGTKRSVKKNIHSPKHAIEEKKARRFTKGMPFVQK
jgi:DNA polymerase-4/DNA polymerase V